MPRDTFANVSDLFYRLRAAGTLLGVTDNTIRGYADNAGIPIRRASDINPGSPAVRIFDPDTVFRLAQWRRTQGYTRSPDKAPQVITVDVIKGGTGKTTTAVELALHLQCLGLRTLLIDLDIQANATQMMGYEPDLTPEEAGQYDVSQEAIVTRTFSNLLIPFIESRSRGSLRLSAEDGAPVIKMPFGEAGPHLVPADTFLGDVEQAIANAKGQRELYIRQMLGAAAQGRIPGFETSRYDVILFDCPPSVSFTSTAALAAADYVIAPIRLDAFSIKGLIKLMREIEVVHETYQVRPDLVILPTYYAPQLARIGRMQTRLQQHYRDLISPNAISMSEEFPKSIDNYLPLTLLKPTSNASREYRMFAEYMFGKLVGRKS